MGKREDDIAARIEAAGLPRPSAIHIAKSGQSVAVAFKRGTGTDTIEGCGSTDDEAADDVIRQFKSTRSQS